MKKICNNRSFSPVKIFNIASPMIFEDHYMVQNRLDEPIICQLINEKYYFILHAPRQTGKTTEIANFVEKLNKEITYKVLYVNFDYNSPESKDSSWSKNSDKPIVLLSLFCANSEQAIVIAQTTFQA